MNSFESPYFTDVKQGSSVDENIQSLPKRQTRSITNKKETCKLKLEAISNAFSKENAKFKRTRKTSIPIQEDSVKQTKYPENWEAVLNNIRTMRADRDAPVDQMGAEQCAYAADTPEVKRFQVLVSLMLSSQTKDQTTFAAIQNLKKHGLTVQNMINTDEDVIANLIHPVGFWKKKASYIKRTAQFLADNYNGDIPQTVEELCKLPGVGQKMAVLTINIGWEKTVGIGVDTHVHRIANRLGWTRNPTKKPEQTQKELEDWLPRELWDEVNVLLVGFGQQQCTPVKPHCGTCLNKDLCPVGKSLERNKN